VAIQFTNPGPIEFTAIIRRNTTVNNSSAWVEFPYDLKDTFGVGNLVPVKVAFDDKIKYEGSLAKMGGPSAMLLLRKDVREKLGKQPGDTVEVKLELDERSREIIVSGDIRASLVSTNTLDNFSRLSNSHKKEYVQWIESAKKTGTREVRIQKMCSKLLGQ
jgi:hypothetical protein